MPELRGIVVGSPPTLFSRRHLSWTPGSTAPDLMPELGRRSSYSRVCYREQTIHCVRLCLGPHHPLCKGRGGGGLHYPLHQSVLGGRATHRAVLVGGWRGCFQDEFHGQRGQVACQGFLTGRGEMSQVTVHRPMERALPDLATGRCVNASARTGNEIQERPCGDRCRNCWPRAAGHPRSRH